MVTDHAATALDKISDLTCLKSTAHQFANCCRIACLVVHPSRHHAINRLLPLRVLGLIFEPLRHDKNTKSTLPAGVPNEWN
jgi:hypothetical protein